MSSASAFKKLSHREHVLELVNAMRGTVVMGTGAAIRSRYGIEADVAAMFHEPVSAGLHVRAMLWLGGDATEADVRAKFVHEARLVTREIIQN